MSELYMHKFVGGAWDEFCDDHIVPDPGNKGLNSHFMLGDSHKKRHCELVSNSSNTKDRSTTRYDDQEGEQVGIPPLSKRRNTMLEGSNIASDSTMSSAHGLKSNNRNSNSGEFGGLDTILDDNDIKYFENAEKKGSMDLLYCDWPQMENFEDIDRMFGNCDSTFDLGVHGEDNLGWLSSNLEPSEVENISENHEFSNSYSIDDSIRYKDSSWTSEKSDSYGSFVIGPDIADCKDGFIPQEQVATSERKKPISQEMQSQGKSKEHYLGNYILPSEVGKLSSGLTSHQVLQSVHMQQQLPPDLFGYSLNSISNMHSDNSHLSDPSSVNLKLSLVKSETSDLTSISPRDSSQNKQESLTVSPDLDDISLEAASFCQQLQLVMEKLDFRTKLCIRDSLYRLAQSAEQRHNLANLNAGCGEEGDEETNRYTSFIETNTNPIDRSVAHLLFHRSSDSSTKLVQDSSPFKSSNAAIVPATSSLVMADNLVSEGSMSEVEKVTDEQILV